MPVTHHHMYQLEVCQKLHVSGPIVGRVTLPG